MWLRGCWVRWKCTLEEVRGEVTRIVGEGEHESQGQIPFTPRAKKVLELALREALSLGHNYIGTEHILLGLVRESEGVAARILADLEVDAERVRQEVMRVLAGPTRRRRRAVQRRRVRPRARTARAPKCSTSSVATSPDTRRRTSSTPSSVARPRSNASCRSCPGAPRTIPCWSASRAWARPRWSKAWLSASPRTTCPGCSRTSRSTPSTWAPWWPARSTGASSKSGSRR